MRSGVIRGVGDDGGVSCWFGARAKGHAKASIAALRPRRLISGRDRIRAFEVQLIVAPDTKNDFREVAARPFSCAAVGELLIWVLRPVLFYRAVFFLGLPLPDRAIDGLGFFVGDVARA